MQPSTDSGVTVQTNFPQSVQPSLQNSVPSNSPFSMGEKEAKVRLANQVKVAQDSWQNLETTAASNKQLRQQTLQLRQAQMQKAVSDIGGEVTPVPETGSDMGDVLIDSPTVHNHYPAPTPSGPGGSVLGSLASKVLPLALAGLLGGGAAVGVGLLQGRPAVTATPQTINNTNGFNLELVPTEK